MRAMPILAVLMPSLCGVALAQDWHGFPPYPASKLLCEQRVQGSAREIHWTTYTSADPPQVVTAFYETRLGRPETDNDEARFRAAREGAIERILSVHPVGTGYPRCGKDPGADDGARVRTVMIVSRAIAR